MKTSAALKYYEKPVAIAAALGISASAVRQWADIVPYWSAMQLHQASGGAIPLDSGDYGPGGRILHRKASDPSRAAQSA